MTLVGRRRKALALEDVAEVAAAFGADDLGPEHSPGAILVPGDSARQAVEVGRPPTARLELVVGLVQRRIATSTAVHALGGVVLVILPGSRRLSALLPENSELL